MIKYIILWVITGALITPLNAAKNKKIFPRDIECVREGREITVKFMLNMEQSVSDNYKIILTPLLKKGNGEAILKSILFETRRTRILDKRNKTVSSDYGFNGQYNKTLFYTTTLPYEPWMHGASLYLKTKIIGCCSESDEQYPVVSNISFIPDPVDVYQIQPQFSLIKPEVEIPKVRHERGSAYVEFRQGSSTLRSDYRENMRELNKIKKSIDEVKRNDGTIITGIMLSGTCSPEASWEFNSRLASERANSVKAYVSRTYGVKDTLLKVSSYPEDWSTFRQIIEASDRMDKGKLLTVIDSDDQPDQKEQKLSAMLDYSYLLTNIYPLLRRVDYQINYEVKGFDLEESRNMFRLNPKNLSLNELYILANSYSVSSPEFEQIFEVAAREFPEDPVANINAAVVALRRMDVELADTYLMRISDVVDAQYLNLKGIVAIYKGEYEQAQQFLQMAREEGCKDALHNQEEFIRKMNNTRLIEEREYLLHQ